MSTTKLKLVCCHLVLLTTAARIIPFIGKNMIKIAYENANSNMTRNMIDSYTKNDDVTVADAEDIIINTYFDL